MTRRSLLAMLALAAADPERLVWVPGKKLISIPPPPPAVNGFAWIEVVNWNRMLSDCSQNRLALWLEKERSGLGDEFLAEGFPRQRP